VDELAPEVVIADARRSATVRLGYEHDLGCLWVAVESPPQVRVRGLVYAEFARELAEFFRNLALGPLDPAAEPRRVSSSDDELCVEAWPWPDKSGIVALGVSLAEDMWDPEWVVRVNLLVASADLARVAASIEGLSRYADGLPPLPAAEPGVVDPRR
jgi:hypothetical protein